MAHELDTNANGDVRFAYNAARGLPWHGLGQGCGGLMTSVEAIKQAHLDYTVALRPVFKQLSSGGFQEIESRFAITNEETDDVYGIVSERYTVLQNVNAFDFVDALLDSDEAHLDTAGAIKKGSHVFLTARLPDGATIADEAYIGSLLLSNAHTGLAAVVVKLVMTRVVCSNTLSAAIGEHTPTWSFPHVTGMEEKLDQARETLKLATAYQNDFKRVMEQLAESKQTQKAAEDLIRQALPERMRSPKCLEQAMGYVNTSGNIPDNLRRTAFGTFNGFTEWMEHGRPSRSAEGRFNNVTTGEGARSRDRMLRLLKVA